MLRRTPALAVTGLLLCGCAPATTADPAAPTTAPAPTPSAAPTPSPSPDPDGRLVGRGTVIDEGSGPMLCFGVLQSYPPQCGGGVELVGWRWPERGVERVNKTTWGDFAVVGTYDGKWFKAEKTVDPATLPQPEEDEHDFSTPCPEPAGGWRAPDPARATYETQDQALRLAERRPGYADAWIDDLGDSAQDPAKIVLNVRFTRDLADAERAIRQVWGGALCVSKAKTTQAELMEIQREMSKTPGVLSSGGSLGHLELLVVFDDGTLQRKLDSKYGKGLVRVSSALQPYAE